MAVSPSNLSRVSNLQRSSLVSRAISAGQRDLMKTQTELTTQRRLNAPSDDAADAAVAQQVRKQLEQFESYKNNLGAAASQLAEVDNALDDVSNLVLRANQLASATVGSDVTQAEREGALAELDSIHRQLLTTANRSLNGQYLFAGDRLTQPPYVEEGGGVKFVGNDVELRNTFDHETSLAYSVSGASVFGGLSARVSSGNDLRPAVYGGTRLDSLDGGQAGGVPRGFIQIGNGSTSAVVDLTQADTLGDVINLINAAGVGGITAGIGADGQSLALTGGGSDNITVTEVGGGTVAGNLGILTNVGGGAGVAVAGASLMPRITLLTPAADLAAGSGIDLASGITITNGLRTATIGFGSAVTVEDVLNAINDSGTGVRAQIKADGTGIEVLNPIQGNNLTIGENGGTTAANLGIRSYGPASTLSELNFGKGVKLADGADLRLTDASGASADVDLSTAATVGDVISIINAAGTGVTASFAAVGNGIVLTDTSGGAGTMELSNLNFSTAVQDLGLDGPVSGIVMSGRDVNEARTEGVFTHLLQLRKALESGDSAGVTLAAEALDEDYDQVVRRRGDAGARLKEFENRLDQLETRKLTTTGLLSELEDTDFNEAILKFQTLQTNLQATYQTGSRLLNLSLMDFLG